jgi:staphylopine/pseudopaline/yersinopine synthase
MMTIKAPVSPEDSNHVRPFGNTLLVGAGPAAIQVAADFSRGWCEKLGLLNRKGPHAARLKTELEQQQSVLSIRVQGETSSQLSGQVRVDRFYEGFENVEDIWNTVVICTPSDSFKEIVRALRLDSRNMLKTIILLSPGIGSNLLVTSQLKQAKERVEVISLSTYYAATKYESEQASILAAVTKALKKRIYVASSKTKGTAVLEVKRLIESLGIQCTVVGHSIEAESRGITTYVHPPFFLNDFSLREIFNSEQPSKKSMYKIYPEGPITQHTIRTMVLLWKEVSRLIQHFGFEPVNLLKFLNDDNYPVHEITLSREDIETFMERDQTRQEYLLYIRYSAILIDPFSIPDENGRYFDFSAVPYKQVYQDQHGRWVIPRIPFEDYKRLKLLEGLARKANLPMPQAGQLIQCFEKKLDAFVTEKGREWVHPDTFADTTREDVDAIWQEMGGGR